MPYRNKMFVSFDGDSDIHYYRLMCAWKQNDRSPFSFADAHDINTALDTSSEVTIKARLAERMRNTKVFVVLIGEQTRYLYKFVRWEIEQAIRRDLPIIGVNLDGLRSMDGSRCPPLLRDALAVHVCFNSAILQHALENWPQSHRTYRSQDKSGPYYYNANIYKGLGL